jgi:hypothetical protein
MRRTTLAVALATGALAIPAVALAAGGDDPATTTAPVQQQEQQQQQQPDQQQQRPDRGDCPEHDGGAAPERGAAPSPSPESGSGGSNDTFL